MPNCWAPGCTNSPAKGFKLVCIPSDPVRRALWEANIGKSDGKRSSRLCPIHFEESQFEQNRADGLRKLKPNAVPTLFPPPEEEPKRKLGPSLFSNPPSRSQKMAAKIQAIEEAAESDDESLEEDKGPSLSSNPPSVSQKMAARIKALEEMSESDDESLDEDEVVLLNRPGAKTIAQLPLVRDTDERENAEQPVHSHFTRYRRPLNDIGTSETQNVKRFRQIAPKPTEKNHRQGTQMATVHLDAGLLFSLRSSSLPPGWCWPDQAQPSFAYLHRCPGKRYEQWTVIRQVELFGDASYSLLIHGRAVSPERFPPEWPRFVYSSETLSALLECVSDARICAGNPEEEFCRLLVAGAVPEDAWDSNGMTVRASGCHLLSTEWYQCTPCQELREKMHRIVDDFCVENGAQSSTTKAASSASCAPPATSDHPKRLPFTLSATNDSIAFGESSTNPTVENKELGDNVLTECLPFVVRHALKNMTPDELKEPLVVRRIVQSGGVKKDEKVYFIKEMYAISENSSIS